MTLLITVLLPGCATAPDGTVDDRQQTIAEGAIAGAVLGGLLGAAVSRNKASGALIGAAAGGLIGAGIGSTIADRKAQYASEEDFLVAEIRRNQDFIQEADAQNRQLYREIAQLDRESRRLTREYRAGQVSRDALSQQKAGLEKQLAKAKQIQSLTEKQLTDAQQVYQESQQKRGTQDQYTQQLETNVVELKETQKQSSQNVASLQRVYDNMAI
ncbi:MAG: glycine zipper 2TM domain-containing protein [Gammaproteobacteria bacterium]|nr:glycine zipper 2TM domain-containing protein [Gammaproteobacteria bacterium]MCP5196514.1 glycine zipper 2TM domain-containing protein [Gammaproteobacteria bacterium]